MLDIKYIRENPEKVQQCASDKGYELSIAELLEGDAARRELLGKVEALQQKRNALAGRLKGGQPDQAWIAEGKALKTQLAALEAEHAALDSRFADLLGQVPNTFSDDTPIGPEAAFTVKSEHGATKTGALDHLDLATQRGWVDFERGAKVAGSKFYYLKGDLARLQAALLMFGLEKIAAAGFTLLDTPYLVNEQTAAGTGFAPRSDQQSDSYFVEGEDLTLIGTA